LNEQNQGVLASGSFLLLSLFFLQTILPSSKLQVKLLPQNPQQEKNDKIRSSNCTLATAPMLILTFDDNWRGQIKYVKPILEKYTLNEIFCINCNIIDKDRAPLYAPVQRGKILTWNNIEELKKAGFDIQSHGMNHDRVSMMSQPQLDYEIGESSRCLLDHGVDSTVFATPFSEGTQNKSVISTVAKYFQIGRSGYGDAIHLKCDQYSRHPQTDCQTYDEQRRITYANRFNIRTWNHNGLDSQLGHESKMIFSEFIKEVTIGLRTKNMSNDETIPVLVYHNIENFQTDNVPPQWINSTTDVHLFDQEMKYLSDHHFRTLSMADIAYNYTSNTIYIKRS
jgi:peptidoglycan/xylan/chitin deacetylase (PgdA/CDA1 family)